MTFSASTVSSASGSPRSAGVRRGGWLALLSLVVMTGAIAGCDDKEPQNDTGTNACATVPTACRPVSVPKEWFCEAQLFAEVERGKAAGDASCDCACGAVDPDCATDFSSTISQVSDHARVEDEPGGMANQATCKRCVASGDGAGSACSP